MNICRLIDQLIAIYQNKINNRNQKIFRQEIRCNHQKKNQTLNICDENFCSQKFLTHQDFLIAQTGFNIFILLTIFKELFPDTYILRSFEIEKIDNLQYSVLYNKHAKRDKKNIIKTNILQKPESGAEQLDLKGSKKSIADKMTFTDFPQQQSPNQIDSEKKSSIKLKFDGRSKDGFQSLPLNEEESVQVAESITNKPPEESPTLQNNSSFLQDKSKDREATLNDISPTIVDLDLGDEEEDEYIHYLELRKTLDLNGCIEFFKGFIGSVEILKDEELSKCYFQVPFECDYITENIRNDLLFKANRNSDVERLEHFMSRVELYKEELNHRQSISKLFILEWFVKNWRFFKDIAFLFVVMNNLLMIIEYQAVNDPDGTIRYRDQDDNNISGPLNLVYLLC